MLICACNNFDQALHVLKDFIKLQILPLKWFSWRWFWIFKLEKYWSEGHFRWDAAKIFLWQEIMLCWDEQFHTLRLVAFVVCMTMSRHGSIIATSKFAGWTYFSICRNHFWKRKINQNWMLDLEVVELYIVYSESRFFHTLFSISYDIFPISCPSIILLSSYWPFQDFLKLPNELYALTACCKTMFKIVLINWISDKC